MQDKTKRVKNFITNMIKEYSLLNNFSKESNPLISQIHPLKNNDGKWIPRNNILLDWPIFNPNYFAIATIPLPKVLKIISLWRHLCFSECILLGIIVHLNINNKQWCLFNYRIKWRKSKKLEGGGKYNLLI